MNITLNLIIGGWLIAVVLWCVHSRRFPIHSQRFPLKRRVMGTIILIVIPMLGVQGWLKLVQFPLLTASADGDLARVQTLLARGALVNVESNGLTALGNAAKQG